MANLFSEVTGITIEHFIIAHKIEKVKELLLYDELTLTEISYKLHYSSVAHLSNQFKKVTGLTPSYFKHLKEHKKRIHLEDI
jgi:AraC-like DNA-binding protein